MSGAVVLALLIVYGLSMLVSLIALIIYAIRLRRQLVGLWRYGLLMGAILIGCEVLVLSLVAFELDAETFGFIIGADLVSFVRVLLSTTVGICLSAPLDIAALRWLGKKDTRTAEPRPAFTGLEAGYGTSFEGSDIMPAAPEPGSSPEQHVETLIQADGANVESPALADSKVAAPAQPQATRPSLASWGMSTFVVLAGTVLYTIALFAVTRPQMSEAIKRANPLERMKSGTLAQATAVAVVALISVAFAEEVVFRLGIQNLIARIARLGGRKYWIAIVLASFFWTAGHAAALNPFWVKLLQIFPIGLALGWLYKRHGLEACIVVHAGMNLALALLSSWFIS